MESFPCRGSFLSQVLSTKSSFEAPFRVMVFYFFKKQRDNWTKSFTWRPSFSNYLKGIDPPKTGQVQSVKLIHWNRIPKVIPVFQDSHTLLFTELLVLMDAHKEEKNIWCWVVWVVSDLSVLLGAKKIFYFNNHQGVSESFFPWSNNDVVKHFESDLPRSLGGEIFCVIQHLQCSLVR